MKYIVLLFFMTSCSYKFCKINDDDKKISIPYVKGDEDGKLTSEIIKQLGFSGIYSYSNDKSNYKLEISVLNNSTEQIGYSYDRDEITGELKKRIIPTKGRKLIKINVQIIDTKKNKIILGPQIIEETNDYDFVNIDSVKDISFIDNQNTRRSVLEFSLGQLDSKDDAALASLDLLYKKLAKKIVSFMLTADLSDN